MGLHGQKFTGRTRGFTLVELLLAITLMSILLGLTYSGLRAATRASERGEVMLAATGGMRATHQFVRRQLNQMLPLAFALADDNNEARVVFSGDASSIQYVAPMPGYLGSGGPQVQFLELAQGSDGSVLQFSHALLQGYEELNLLERDPIILLEGIQSAGFEFLGRDEAGELTGWMSSWEQFDVLPVAVRLSVDFSDSSQLLWPDLLAGVRLDEAAISEAGGIQEKSMYQKKMQELISGKSQESPK
jgi:general secretion pathway protein J